MADEQDTWLNRATAERLLRGEPLEAVDASARDQAERLGRALGALSVRTAAADAELPGEEAAVAAFRKARESAEAEPTVLAPYPGRTGRGADAGLFRIGAGPRPARVPGRARPARLALAAALAAGVLGGGAVAAGTGILPTPFDDNRPGPAASVSAAGTPGRPQDSPSPESLMDGGTGTPSSGARSGGSGKSSPDPSGKGEDKGKDKGTGSAGTSGSEWSNVLASCRDIRNGKSLGADRRRALEGRAGGAGRVSGFCRAALGTGGDGKGGAGGQGTGAGDTNGQGGDDDGHSGGRGRGGGAGHGGDDRHRDGAAAPAPGVFAPSAPNPSAVLPGPTYSAL